MTAYRMLFIWHLQLITNKNEPCDQYESRIKQEVPKWKFWNVNDSKKKKKTPQTMAKKYTLLMPKYILI